ncbi:hypothetical protein Lfu02_11120 [Longispora fulva]|nr:hypothetical protein Lfu02_11120 [Longispora fulva]
MNWFGPREAVGSVRRVHVSTADTVTGYPVPSRKISRFAWQTGPWFEVFERQVLLIQEPLRPRNRR